MQRLAPFELELREAHAYYRTIDPALANRFLNELDAAIKRIAFMPLAWTKIGADCRRCRMKVFPYSVVYLVEEGQIILVALAHAHRTPQYWLPRLS
jgi:plasmid stabilization system protein ParE